MSSQTAYAVQAFDESEGQIVPGDQVLARSAEGALRRGAGINTFKPGAAVLEFTRDEASGAVREVTVLATFGRVPTDFGLQPPVLRPTH